MSAIHRLPTATPETQGIATSSILAFLDAVEAKVNEMHSFILVRHGHIVAEAYWLPYAKYLRHSMFSLSKSFTSTAVGLAITEGYFSLDDLVISHFPDDLPPSVSENLAKMRVRHLLTMSTGHEGETMPFMLAQPDGNWSKGFLDTPIVNEPGTRFFYNTGATYMLSALVQKTTGQTLSDYLKPRLFQPLGIDNPHWDNCPRGIDVGGFGLNIRTQDIANFGQLYLQKGIWEDKRLLSAEWVEMATSWQISNADFAEKDWGQGYGFQFWRCQHNLYRGDGAFGQYCIVMPEQDAVLAITSGTPDMQVPLDIVWETLLPAMQSSALPENPQANAELTSRLNQLQLEPVAGDATSPIAPTVNGTTYNFPSNPINIESIRFNFAEKSYRATIKMRNLEETIIGGFGEWHNGSSHLFKDHPLMLEQVMKVSGAWQDESSFKLLIRLYETPFFFTILCRFEDLALDAVISVNVSFEPEKSFHLRATPS